MAMSLMESPIMTVRSALLLQRTMVRRSNSGSGFCNPNVSAPQTAAKRGSKARAPSRRTESHSSLFVQTAKRQPRPASASSAAATPGNGRDRSAMCAP